MAAKRVMLTRPEQANKRVYSRPSRSEGAVPGPGPDSGGKGEENKIGQKIPRGVTPSIEGGITPRFSAAEKAEEEKKAGVDGLLKQALALGPKERKLLLASLALAERPEQAGGRDLDMWALGVARALGDAAGAGAGGGYGELLVRRSLAPASAWQPVAEFMERAGLSGLEVVRRQSVYFMLADLLVQYSASVAAKVGAPLTPRFVANNARHVGAVFENAFPGYLGAGMAPLVAARLTGGVESI